MPLPRTVGLVCVCVGGGGGNQDVITIQASTMTPLSATVSRKCVGVGRRGWGSGYKCLSLLKRIQRKSEKMNATLSVCIINRCVQWQTVQFLIRTQL